MSDSDRPWLFYVQDMIRFADRVLEYTVGLDMQMFEDRDLTYDATLRNLELIGEAATRIPDAICEAHPEVPWRRIIALRNRLIHGYLGLDNETLWAVITSDVPEPIETLQRLVERHS